MRKSLNPRRKQPDEIVDFICTIFEISRNQLFCEVRKRRLVDARMVLVHILWHQDPWGITLHELGYIMERDHTSIIHYLQSSHRCDIYNPQLYDKLRLAYLQIYGDDRVPFLYGMKKEFMCEIKKEPVETGPQNS